MEKFTCNISPLQQASGAADFGDENRNLHQTGSTHLNVVPHNKKYPLVLSFSRAKGLSLGPVARRLIVNDALFLHIVRFQQI